VQESNDEPQRRNTDAVEWFWGGVKASKGNSRGVVGEHLGTADARSSVGKGVVVLRYLRWLRCLTPSRANVETPSSSLSRISSAISLGSSRSDYEKLCFKTASIHSALLTNTHLRYRQTAK